MAHFLPKKGFSCLEGTGCGGGGSHAEEVPGLDLDDAEGAFQTWARRRGFRVVRSVYVVALPVRLAVCFMAMKDSASAGVYPVLMTTFGVLSLVWSCRVKLGTERCQLSRTSETFAIEVLQWPFTFFGVSTLFFTESIVQNNRDEKWLRFILNFFVLLVIQGSCMYFNNWTILAALIFVNVPCFILEASWASALDGEIIMRLLMAIGITAAIFLHQTRAARSLYFSRVAEQRARIEVEGQTSKAEAWRGAFRSLLDSVFDASCVCDRSGVVSRSTPHLDQMLLGHSRPGTAASLQCRSLLDFAANKEEWRRFQGFLASIPETSAARKMQLSLSKPGSCCFDVSISAIALSEEPGAEPQIFLGVEVTASTQPNGAPLQEALPDYCCELVSSFVDNLKLPPEHSPHAPPSIGLSDLDIAGLTVPKVAASAPSVMLAAETDDLSGYNPCPAGDCLPPDALVWQENKAAPTTVCDLELGSRVLCLDHLFGGMKYAPVTKLEQADASSSTWVNVVLQDGTQLTMTSDHPVFPISGDGSGGKGDVLRAQDLQPLQHSLSVVKNEIIKVESVSVLSSQQAKEEGGKLLPSQRVTLSVAQPSRHSVFVRDPRSSHQSSMAVGCGRPELVQGSNAGRRGDGLGMQGMQVKNTFLQFKNVSLLDESSSWCSEVELPLTRLRRSSSAPPSVVHNTVRRDAASSGSAGSVASFHSSVISKSSEGLATVVVVGNGPAADRSVMLMEKVSENHCSVRLTDSLQCRQLGLSSVGSLGHDAGWCVPCIMEGWYQKEGSTAEPCRMHSYCHRCHEAHSAEQVKAVRRSRRRQLRITRAATTTGANSDQSCQGDGFDNDCVIPMV